MNFLKFAKPIAGLVISMSVGAVVQNAVAVTSPADPKLIQKIGIKIGGYVVSSMVADHAVRYSFEELDKLKGMLNLGNPWSETIPGELADEEEKEEA